MAARLVQRLPHAADGRPPHRRRARRRPPPRPGAPVPGDARGQRVRAGAGSSRPCATAASPVDRFVATGGLPGQNPLFVEIVAAVLDAPVEVAPGRARPGARRRRARRASPPAGSPMPRRGRAPPWPAPASAAGRRRRSCDRRTRAIVDRRYRRRGRTGRYRDLAAAARSAPTRSAPPGDTAPDRPGGIAMTDHRAARHRRARPRSAPAHRARWSPTATCARAPTSSAGRPRPSSKRRARRRLRAARLDASSGPTPSTTAAGHGFIGSQTQGREVFAGIDPDAPLVVAEAVWQYSQQVLIGLIRHRGPILIVANWSGEWPGLVGALNLRASLTKAGVDSLARVVRGLHRRAVRGAAARSGSTTGYDHLRRVPRPPARPVDASRPASASSASASPPTCAAVRRSWASSTRAAWGCTTPSSPTTC